MTPDEVESLLELGVNMYLACLTPDGSPYITVCWHEWRDGYFWVIPRQHSRWAEYLASDPRVSFVVEQPKTLGKNQTGSVVALPIWIGYMEKVLKDMPEAPRSAPDGVVTAQVQLLAPGGEGLSAPQAAEPKLVPEYFYQESVPPPEVLRPLLDLPAPVVAPPPPPPTPPPA